MSDGKPSQEYAWRSPSSRLPFGAVANWSASMESTAIRKATIGKSCECWDTDAVTSGAHAGSTIATLRERLEAESLGDLDPTQIFPVAHRRLKARNGVEHFSYALANEIRALFECNYHSRRAQATSIA